MFMMTLTRVFRKACASHSNAVFKAAATGGSKKNAGRCRGLERTMGVCSRSGVGRTGVELAQEDQVQWRRPLLYPKPYPGSDSVT